MNKTKIEWVKNPDNKTQGYTWNPITGCLNHTPEGLCLGGGFPCYAYKLANGRLRTRYLANTTSAPRSYGEPFVEDILVMNDPFYPRFWEDRLRDFGKPNDYGYQIVRQPKGIFVCDMGELFGDWIPADWQKVIFNYIRDYPEHRFYLLTKQPQNLIKFSPFPDNCWVGFTATTDKALQSGLAHIADVEAKIKYISFEPLLERVSFLAAKMVDWVIIGGQTKPYKPPKIEWVEEIVRACNKAGVAVFLKNNLYKCLGLGNGKSICHNNETDTLRQEMPNE